MESGSFKGYGPDGKILIVMEEQDSSWQVLSFLISIQHHPSLQFTHLIEQIIHELHSIYLKLQEHDVRWCSSFKDIKILVNPNGPCLTHIDRLAANAARIFASMLKKVNYKKLEFDLYGLDSFYSSGFCSTSILCS